VQERLPELKSLGAEVLAITFVQPARLGQYLKSTSWQFRVLADPEMKAYRAFGLGRAGWLRLLRPRVMAAYFSLLVRGRRPHMAQEDVHQLGGDFVLDQEGRVVYEYRSQDPADRPSVSELVRAVEEASRRQQKP